MTIEFVGLPGVGKSFVCEQLADYVEARVDGSLVIFSTVDEQLGFATRTKKLGRAIAFFVRHPVVACRSWSWVAKTKQETFLGFSKKMINLLSELQLADRRRGIWANDQGVLQATWSLMLRAQRDADWGELLTMLQRWLPSFVVHVVVGREENIRRLSDRKSGQSRFDRLAPEDLEAELDRGERLLKTLFKERRSLGAPEGEYQLVNELNADLERSFSPFIKIIAQPG